MPEGWAQKEREMNKGIQKLFSEVSNTYELVNHLLTFGLDIAWRKKTAKIASELGGKRWIDVCCGTGEMVAYLSQLAKDDTQIFAADFSLPMLSKAFLKPEGKHIKFVLSDIKKLPFDDNIFDLITISFATRNINLNRDILIQSFSEFYRILKPGGSFINLETSQPSLSLIRKLFHFYAKLFVKPIGSFVSGSKASYTYLSKTIPKFYFAEELVDIMRIAGFNEIHYQKLFLGISAIHQGFKS